ncbi:MAG: glycosyltransferase family 2 protein [Brevinematia bacterium]
MVDILLSTYNGERFLPDLIESIILQSFKNWRLIVRDDGSTDKTIDIILNYSKILGERLHFLFGNEKVGFLKSFDILGKASDRNYIMFCDQDDVWIENKIEITLGKIKELEKKYGEEEPLFVFTDLKIVDEALNTISESYFKFRRLSPYIAFKFNKLLVQNVITGCTVMINKKLKEIAFPIPEEAIFHDWWVGLVASLTGRIGYLNEKTVLYRQHSMNTSGKLKKFDFFYAIEKIMEGKTRIIEDLKLSRLRAKILLERYEDLLGEKEKNTLQVFSHFEEYSFFKRKYEMLRNGFFKSGILRNIYLFCLI